MILSEQFSINPSSIIVENRHDGPMLVRNVLLQRADAKNQNGRIYPRALLEREVGRFLRENVAERRALGCLDHYNNDVVELKHASHNIIGLRWQGNDLYGDLEILPTPAGNIARELIRCGIKIGISSRGQGQVSQRGDAIYVENFNLLTWDLVSTPSVHGAFLTEGVDSSVAYHKVNTLIMDFLTEMEGR